MSGCLRRSVGLDEGPIYVYKGSSFPWGKESSFDQHHMRTFLLGIQINFLIFHFSQVYYWTFRQQYGIQRNKRGILLLVMDNYVQLPCVKFVLGRLIALLCLPPTQHTSSKSCDVGISEPLQAAYGRSVYSHYQHGRIDVINQCFLNSLMS